MTANDSNNVSVLFNKGDGTFDSSIDFAVGRNPVAIATGDLNGDGKSDIVTANVDSGDISVLLNTSM